MRGLTEKLQIWVAWHAPRWLVYWCSIRLMAHATSGKYGNQIVPDLLAMDALKRWETSNMLPDGQVPPEIQPSVMTEEHGADTNQEDYASGTPLVLVSNSAETEKICWSCLGKGDWPKPCRICGKIKGWPRQSTVK